MSYTQIRARVVDQSVQVINASLLASGSEGVLQIKAEFDELWDGYAKTAVFYRNPEQVYHAAVTSGVATIPTEVLAAEGDFYFGFFGVADNTRTTEVVKMHLAQGALTVATANPGEVTPDIYQQLLQRYAVLEARMEELAGMKSEGGVTEVALSDEYIGGTIKSNGASAYLDFTISKMSLTGGGWHYTDYFITPGLAPLAPVELKTSNPDINVTMEAPNEDGWARILIENVGNAMMTTDETTFVRAFYPLASVYISELSDVRVGYDGTRHETAGTAVREQVKVAMQTGGTGGGVIEKLESWAVTETPSQVTMALTMDSGITHTHVLNFDANGNPTSITVDGVAIPGTWEVAASE